MRDKLILLGDMIGDLVAKKIEQLESKYSSKEAKVFELITEINDIARRIVTKATFGEDYSD
jgi:hypothetical protein